jgi:branched-chain amino acid transport system permease protein
LNETKATKSQLTWRSFLNNITGYLLVSAIIIILPFFISPYYQNVAMEILIFGIFAMSLNILWGYTGLPSLGHAAYFGVAGYTVGVLMVNYGINNFWIIAPAGILLAALLAAILGIPALRMAGGYFLLVTLAMGQLIFSLAQKLRNITAGDTGLGGITLPNLHIPGFVMNTRSFYYLIFIIFIISCFLIYRIVKSPFGEALEGIRENEPRMKALGYNTWLHKYTAFILAGTFAGVAGVLFASYNGIMSPIFTDVSTSTIAMLMVVLGSTSVVFGPVLGSVLVIVIETFAIIYAPERWPLILGAVFVFSVMFLRNGMSVYLLKLWRKFVSGSVSS